jgi:hypothetical protein
MTSLTAFEAGAFSPCFVLVGVFLASFQGGFEALDDECLPTVVCFESNRLWLVDR